MSRDQPRRTGAKTVALFDAYPHEYGGAQQISHRLARDLSELGWRVYFVLPAEGQFADRLRSTGHDVDVARAPASLDQYGGTTRGRRMIRAGVDMPSYTLRLRSLLSAASVVHVNDPRGVLLAGPAARLTRRPLVWHLHVVSRWRSVNRLGAALADETVTVSRSALNAMPELRSRAVVEPNPLPREALAAAPVRPGPVPTIVTAGRFHPDKGLDVLLAAMAQVVSSHPRVRLIVLGGPQRGWEPYAAALRAQAASAGIVSNVEFRGWVERPTDHWRDAWLYVQASRSEASPLALLEALAAGLPAVATDVPGLREHVRHRETGLLVPAEDAGRLAGAIDALLSDRALAERLGAAGQKAAGTTIDPAGYASRWAARYERLLRTG